jgi:hypothetical protein
MLALHRGIVKRCKTCNCKTHPTGEIKMKQLIIFILTIFYLSSCETKGQNESFLLDTLSVSVEGWVLTKENFDTIERLKYRPKEMIVITKEGSAFLMKGNNKNDSGFISKQYFFATLKNQQVGQINLDLKSIRYKHLDSLIDNVPEGHLLCRPSKVIHYINFNNQVFSIMVPSSSLGSSYQHFLSDVDSLIYNTNWKPLKDSFIFEKLNKRIGENMKNRPGLSPPVIESVKFLPMQSKKIK